MVSDDPKYTELLHDLATVMEDAVANEFHDYLSRKYVTPKIALVQALEKIIAKTKAGDYDND